MYTAAVLTLESIEILKNLASRLGLEDFVYQTPQGDALPHHMTINLGKFDESLNDPLLLGQEVEITIDSIWHCKTIGACAAKVSKTNCCGSEIKSSNTNKHITICLKPPAKPVHSNKLFSEGSKVFIINEPLVLKAILQEIH